MASKKGVIMKKRISLVEAIADYIENTNGPIKVEHISYAMQKEKEVVRAALGGVKTIFALKGIVLANKRGNGYFLSTNPKSLLVEADKSLKRAKAHIGSAKKLSEQLARQKEDGKISFDASQLLEKLKKDIESFNTLNVCDDEDLGIPEHILEKIDELSNN
jgi:hypothetical protein